jgi:hypothetical protein
MSLSFGFDLGTQGSRGSRASSPTVITLTSTEVAEAAVNGTVIGNLLTAGGAPPYSYALTSDPSSKLAIANGNELQVAGSLAGLSTYSFSVRSTDSDGKSLTQMLSITISETIDNGSGIGEDDGDIVTPDPDDPEGDDGGFEEPPIQQDTSAGLKIGGKNGGSAIFLKDWGIPAIGAVVTMRYEADWSLMSRLGREAAIGFAFKNGNNFHLVGLRGDGRPATTMLESRIYGDFRKANQFTVTNDGAAAHGTKDGPNWVQIEFDGVTGATYTFRTSADGETWVDAYTGITPVPLSGAVNALQFGPGGYFTNQDKGVFTITITTFSAEGFVEAPSNTVAPAITGNRWVGQTLSCSTGTWNAGGGTISGYTYQWKNGGVDIGSATNSTYVLVSGDAGDTISCVVTATNEAGSTPSTSNSASICADVNFSSVVLLLGFEGADGATATTDVSPSAHAMTFVGNAQLDTGVTPPFGTSSLLLDGTGDYLTTPDSADWNLAGGDFTIEAWIRRTDVTSGDNIVSQWGNTQRSWTFTPSSGALGMSYSINLTATHSTQTGTWSPSNDAWYSVAVTKASGIVYFFADGVLLNPGGATSGITLANSTALLHIGKVENTGGNDFGGHIKELRITKGLARYTDDYIPSGPFPRP